MLPVYDFGEYSEIMAQSRQSMGGDLRIPKNNPYNRIRHIDWRELDDPKEPAPDVQADVVDDVDPKADDQKVWTF